MQAMSTTCRGSPDLQAQSGSSAPCLGVTCRGLKSSYAQFELDLTSSPGEHQIQSVVRVARVVRGHNV